MAYAAENIGDLVDTCTDFDYWDIEAEREITDENEVINAYDYLEELDEWKSLHYDSLEKDFIDYLNLVVERLKR